MTRTPSEHEMASRLFLAGHLSSTMQIASVVRASPRTVERWRREGDWDDLKRRIPVRAAELLVQRLGRGYDQAVARQTEILGLILVQVGSHLAEPALALDELKRLEGVVAGAMKDLSTVRDQLARGVAVRERFHR
jgi:hypothetical protein